MKKPLLYWMALGGNNQKTLGGNAHLFRIVPEKGPSVAIQIDLGCAKYSKEIEPYHTAFPDLDNLYQRLDGENAVDALFLTHGHDDHLMGIIHHLKRGIAVPPVYGSPLAIALLKIELQNFYVPQNMWPRLNIIRAGQKIDIGGFSVTPFSVSHSKPDCFGYVIEGAGKRIVHTGDFKIDQTMMLGRVTDIPFLKQQRRKGVDLLLADATKAMQDYPLITDAQIRKSLHKIFDKHKGQRIISCVYGGYLELVACMAYQAAIFGRTLVVDSASVRRYLRAFAESGQPLEDFIYKKTGKKLHIIDSADTDPTHIPDGQTVVLTDGARAEKDMGLSAALAQEHKWLRINAGDVLFAASTIFDKGSHQAETAEKLRQKGVTVLESREHQFVARGHETWAGLKNIIQWIQPRILIGCYGIEKMTAALAEKAKDIKHMNMQILNPKNGEIFLFGKKKLHKIGQAPVYWIGTYGGQNERTPNPKYGYKLTGPERKVKPRLQA